MNKIRKRRFIIKNLRLVGATLLASTILLGVQVLTLRRFHNQQKEL